VSYFTFHDISYAQGRYNMDADSAPVVEMKMSGFFYGSKTPYMDVQATTNYGNAIRLNKTPICYHYAGGANPVTEAEYFVKAVSPLADGDIYELDYELTAEMGPPADPDSWCRAFADRVKELTGAYPLLYTNTLIFLANNKFPKTMEVCGLIIADYRFTPDQDVPCGHPYIIHQFTDSPLDTNACFVSLDVLKKYARGANQPVITVVPQPITPAPQPAPLPEPTPAPTPVVQPAPVSTTTTSVVTPPAPLVKLSFWAKLIAFLKNLSKGVRGAKRG